MQPSLDQSWSQVRGFMRERCGVVIAADQIYLLEARLTPVAKRHAFPSIADYVRAACAPGAPRVLSLALIDAMTTHETLFFRDAGFYETLDTQVLPEIAKNLSGRRLRIWCAACSTGQEPYSIAMLLAERHPSLFERTDIIATDVAEPTLEQGRAGIYSTLEVNRGLHASRLLRFFEQVPGGFRVVERLRNRVQWTVCNLLDPWCHEDAYDIVLCRNVLIYFSPEDRERIVKRLYTVVRPKGYLGVGSTESIVGNRLSAGWYVNQKAVAQ